MLFHNVTLRYAAGQGSVCLLVQDFTQAHQKWRSQSNAVPTGAHQPARCVHNSCLGNPDSGEQKGRTGKSRKLHSQADLWKQDLLFLSPAHVQTQKSPPITGDKKMRKKRLSAPFLYSLVANYGATQVIARYAWQKSPCPKPCLSLISQYFEIFNNNKTSSRERS